MTSCASPSQSVPPDYFKNISRNPGFCAPMCQSGQMSQSVTNLSARRWHSIMLRDLAPVMNEEDVIEMLRREVARAGSGAAWARKHGFSRAYISDLLTGKSGRSEIGARLLDALGLEVVYRRKKRTFVLKVGGRFEW